VAQARVLAALKRQAWPEGPGVDRPWPQFHRKPPLVLPQARSGAEPLEALIEAFLDTWQLGTTDQKRVKQRNGVAKASDISGERKKWGISEMMPTAMPDCDRLADKDRVVDASFQTRGRHLECWYGIMGSVRSATRLIPASLKRIWGT
jgi:hypothetical protein